MYWFLSRKITVGAEPREKGIDVKFSAFVKLAVAAAFFAATVSAANAGYTMNTIGGTKYAYDGLGNTTSYNHIGGTTYVNQGGNTTSYNQIGGTTYGSDGSTMNHIGNSTYINDGHGNTTTCNQIGNSTYCN